MDLVSEAAEAFMKAAIQEVQSLTLYKSEGEVVCTQSCRSLLDSG